MDKKINEHLILITGKAFLLEPINPEHRFTITGGQLESYSVEDKDNQDGTFNRVFKARFVSAPEFVQTGKKIPGKIKGKKSQAFRISTESFLNEAQADGELRDMDEKDYYDYIMGALISHPRAVHELVKRIYAR